MLEKLQDTPRLHTFDPALLNSGDSLLPGIQAIK